MSILTKYLGIGTEANDATVEAAERVETVTEFFGDVAEKLPDLIEKAEDATDRLPDLFGKAIESAAPWLTATADALGEALPPVKAILSLAKFLTRETDPQALGLLAVSVAYQAALADAAKEIARDAAMRARLGRLKPVRRLPRADLGDPEKPEAFEGFRLASALSHPLVRRADQTLRTVAEAAGYPEEVGRALLEGVHVRFVEQFRTAISDGKVKEKFDPLFRLMELGGREVATYAFLRRHLKYQLWRFTRAPALGKGGVLGMRTPLAQFFTPLDCGVLNWGEIRRANRAGLPEGRRSPFDEDFGGRIPLLAKVLDLIRDPDFKDAIVVQGTAGSGKSAFTLQLCQALHHMALRPIRVRMRDLSLDPRISLMEDVAQALALNCGDEVFETEEGPCPPAADLDLLHILDESVQLGGVMMSPYVLIFDGWDEISISASEGFRIQIEKTLDAIRRQVLSGHLHRVRVVLTGRPSDDVNEAKFLWDETPVLTVRPFTHSQLRSFVDHLKMQSESMLPNSRLPTATSRIDALLEQFIEGARDTKRTDQSILGLPLLALLAILLMLHDENPPENLTAGRSSLYRRLVDLTTRYGGNIEPLSPKAPKITGDELRGLLQQTAAAMTLRGTEHIAYDELILWLEASSSLTNPETAVGRAIGANQIGKLMLSFFFNTGTQGCEFTHKSFREYLFAEAIVEALKRNAAVPGSNPPRAVYWREFDDGDPRRGLAEEIGLMLAPHWIRPEVWRHILWLVCWEVARAVATGGVRQSGEETMPLRLGEWEVVRDRLADLWDWWAEGVHMRPQPYRERGKTSITFIPPYALRLAEQITPTNLPRGSLPEPLRLTTLDAHLGDGLLRLNSTLHFQINKATGWLDRPSLSGPDFAESIWDGAERVLDRRYQTRISQGERTWWAFAPSSPDGTNQYLEYYFARINAAGWHPLLRVPSSCDFSGVDFAGVSLPGVEFSDTSFKCARLKDANLLLSNFFDCDFAQAYAQKSRLAYCRFYYAIRLESANFQGADFDGSMIIGWFPKGAGLPHFEEAKQAFVGSEEDFLRRFITSADRRLDEPGKPGPAPLNGA
jgi:uncharacterized protein YjbI with pentapeptide repeats